MNVYKYHLLPLTYKIAFAYMNTNIMYDIYDTYKSAHYKSVHYKRDTNNTL